MYVYINLNYLHRTTRPVAPISSSEAVSITRYGSLSSAGIFRIRGRAVNENIEICFQYLLLLNIHHFVFLKLLLSACIKRSEL